MTKILPELFLLIGIASTVAGVFMLAGLGYALLLAGVEFLIVSVVLAWGRR